MLCQDYIGDYSFLSHDPHHSLWAFPILDSFLLTTHRGSGGSHSFVISNESASLSFAYAAWSVRIAQPMVRALTQHGLCALGQYIRTSSIVLYSLDLISSESP